MFSYLIKGISTGGFSWATLSVNLAGCLLVGLFYGLFARLSQGDGIWCLLLVTGFCGGFTTFSAFANEGFLMLSSGNVWGFIGYVTSSVILGVALVALGYFVVK